jgi:DNA uptake protein ComE-like DNA-binding protein
MEVSERKNPHNFLTRISPSVHPANLYWAKSIANLEKRMNRSSIFISLILLCVILLAACSTATPTVTSSTTDSNNSSSQSTESAIVTKVNLNTATGDDFLAAIPGLGNRMVREFMEYRPYISIQQFRQEIGKYVDEAQVAEYETYVYVPIAINDSDAATLQQIPGLDASEAESLMSGRPFASPDDFLVRLSEFVSADELEIAKVYLGGN